MYDGNERGELDAQITYNGIAIDGEYWNDELQ